MPQPTQSNPSTLSHQCYNCREKVQYFVDDSQGVNCSACTPDQMCEECQLDAKYPHVVAHNNSFCGGEYRGKTKSEAVESFKESNKPKTKHR